MMIWIIVLILLMIINVLYGYDNGDVDSTCSRELSRKVRYYIEKFVHRFLHRCVLIPWGWRLSKNIF